MDKIQELALNIDDTEEVKRLLPELDLEMLQELLMALKHLNEQVNLVGSLVMKEYIVKAAAQIQAQKEGKGVEALQEALAAVNGKGKVH